MISEHHAWSSCLRSSGARWPSLLAAGTGSLLSLAAAWSVAAGEKLLGPAGSRADATSILVGTPLLVLLLGLLVTGLFTTLLWQRRLAARALQSAEHCLHRYREVVETSNEMLLFVDRDLRLQIVNPAFAVLFASTPDDLQGELVMNVLSERSYACVAPELQASLAGQARHYRLEDKFAGGVAMTLDVDQVPFLTDGQIEGVVVSLHDVSNLDLAISALESERLHLEERVAERTAELQSSEAKLRTIHDLLPIGLAITDPLGQVVDCNRAAEMLFDLSREDQIALAHDSPNWRLLRADGTLMSPADYASVRAMREGRAVRDVEVGIERADGLVWLSVSAMPADHPDYGVVILFVDVTEQRAAVAALRASEARARSIIDASPVPFALYEQGAVTYLNPAFVRGFGYRLQDFADSAAWLRLAYPNRRYRLWVMRTWRAHVEEALRSGRPVEPLTVGLRCRHGGVRQVKLGAVRLSWLGSAAGSALLISIYDITDLKRAQEAAEEAARSKMQFLAHMSHEIRTPMNGIIGLSELTLQRTLDDTTRSYMEELHHSGIQLLGILNDVLDQSKIEAGQLSLEHEPFDCQALLESLRSLFGSVAGAKGLTLVIGADSCAPSWLIGDALRLRQVLSNLLSNAIKFTAQGQVRLHLDCLTQESNPTRLRWSVTDTGLGMDAATQARLFQPFSQGDDSIARRFGGTGLGLSISHHLVNLMGGSLQVKSAPGAGTAFFFELDFLLPDSAPTTAGSVSAPAGRLNLHGRRILVAEDQAINQHIIGDMLRLHDADVILVANGRQALDRLAAESFDLVLMDIQMPEMDGLTAAERLRNNPAWDDLPVIALTAGVTEAERQRIRDVGMNDLLPKPLTLKALSEVLARWLPADNTLVPALEPQAAAPPAPLAANPVASMSGMASELRLPGFDLENLAEVFTTQQEIIEILNEFADMLCQDSAAAENAWRAGHPAEARHIVHRLRGAAGNVGALDLFRVTSELEDAIDHSSEAVSALIEDLHQVQSRTIALIRQAESTHAAN